MRSVTMAAGIVLAVAGGAGSAQADWSYSANTGYVLGQVAGHTVSIPSSNSYNSAGLVNTAVYLGVGSYRVDFPGLATPLLSGDPAPGGDVQVTAIVSNTPARCKVSSWSINETANVVSVYISCFVNGNLRDNNFRASFVAGGGGLEGVDQYGNPEPYQEGGYVWVSQPSASPYTAAGPYTWNSSLGAVTVSPHAYGTGTYLVEFGGQYGGFDFTPNACSAVPAYNGGTVQVTAYGPTNSYCKVDAFYRLPDNNTYVVVDCYNGSTGNPTDSMFDVVFDTLSPNQIPDSAFAWFGNGTTSTYTLDAGYSAVIKPRTADIACPYYESPGNYSVTGFRSSTGKYSVFFPQMTLGTSSLVHAVAFGGDSGTCGNAGAVASTYQGVPGVTVSVNCVSFAGTPADAEFVVTYAAVGVIAVH